MRLGTYHGLRTNKTVRRVRWAYIREEFYNEHIPFQTVADGLDGRITPKFAFLHPACKYYKTRIKHDSKHNQRCWMCGMRCDDPIPRPTDKWDSHGLKKGTLGLIHWREYQRDV